MADLVTKGEISDDETASEAPPLIVAASASPPPEKNISSPEKDEYLSQYGTQILGIFDAENGCAHLSHNFESITGNQCVSLHGHSFFDVVHKDYQERLQEILATPASAAAQSRQFRCKLQHSDHKYYWYLFTIHPEKDAVTNSYVCIINNIHEQMITQHTLQKAKLEAELALRSRSEFLANMSHDLRTPLNAVIGFSQIIESEMFGKIEIPQYVDYIKHIHESGYDLLAKIEDLLEIASIDAGRVSLSREEVQVSDILRHVCEAQAHHAQAAHMTLECAPLPANILLHVDRLKLQHILGHLVANALKFSQPGAKITLKVAMHHKGPHKGQLQLYVHDTGAGMQSEKLAAIVAALGEDNCWMTANDNRAIGLGLALTREFVALHGGNVGIESAPGAGTTITITLPKDCIRSVTLLKSDFLPLSRSPERERIT